MNHTRLIFPDKEALSQAAAAEVLRIANAAIADHGWFAVTLAGGSTPRRLYELLASEQLRTQTDWSKWLIFFGDERLVPPESPDSNYGMAKAALLDRVAIPRPNIFPMVTTDLNSGSESGMTAAYEHTLKSVFAERGIHGFDLMLLGLGSDGHTLSLFPGKPAVRETQKWVVATEPGILPPPVRRITMTLLVVATAKQIFFLAAGQDKAGIIQQILEEEPTPERPASLINSQSASAITWFLDTAAAAMLTPQ